MTTTTTSATKAGAGAVVVPAAGAVSGTAASPYRGQDLSGRDVRQREIVPPQELAACSALVVGVGAVGRQVALQLAAVGLPSITLFDPDVVAVENLAAQGYWPQDLGRPKVQATADVCRLAHPQAKIAARAEPFRRSTAKVLAVPPGMKLALFCCVDSIGTRKMVWEEMKGRCDFFADGRMNGEVVRVLASDSPAADRLYPATLFAPAEAYAGSCTSRSIVYAAGIAAGLMLGQFTRWLRGLPVEPDLLLNLLADELSAGAAVRAG